MPSLHIESTDSVVINSAIVFQNIRFYLKVTYYIGDAVGIGL